MELKMKSKFLVLAVISTFSSAALAEVDFNADIVVPSSLDISVVNSVHNTGILNASIDIVGSDVSISQRPDAAGIAIADVLVNATDTPDTTVNVDLRVENSGNNFSTSVIGAIVQSQATINTGMNTTDETVIFSLGSGDLIVGDLSLSGGQLTDFSLSGSTVSVPEVLVANSAINAADLDASVTMHSSGNLDLQNFSINTNAIGAAVVATSTITVGLGLE